jgi:hypothetical protein
METGIRFQELEGVTAIGGTFNATFDCWSGDGRSKKTAVQRLKTCARGVIAQANSGRYVNPYALKSAQECVEVCLTWLKAHGDSKEANLNVRGEPAWGRRKG